MSFSPHISFRNPQPIHSETDKEYSVKHHHSTQSSSPSTRHSSLPTSEENPEGAPINPIVFHQPLTSVPTLLDFPDPSPAKEVLENILFPTSSKLHPEDNLNSSRKRRRIVPDPTPVIAFHSGAALSTSNIPHDPLINPLSDINSLQPTFISRPTSSRNPPPPMTSYLPPAMLPPFQAAHVAVPIPTPMPHKHDRRFAPRKFRGKA